MPHQSQQRISNELMTFSALHPAQSSKWFSGRLSPSLDLFIRSISVFSIIFYWYISMLAEEQRDMRRSRQQKLESPLIKSGSETMHSSSPRSYVLFHCVAAAPRSLQQCVSDTATNVFINHIQNGSIVPRHSGGCSNTAGRGVGLCFRVCIPSLRWGDLSRVDLWLNSGVTG